MKKINITIFALFIIFVLSSESFGETGIYLGIQGGFSAQKPSLEDVEFNTDTTFLYGLRAGVKFLMLALELNYFQAAHNLSLKDILALDWNNRDIDYSFIGLNLRLFFALPILHPYLTFGYGYYTADIHDVDKDSAGGYNFGLGLELMLGRRLSLSAEGKYHHVTLDIKNLDFGLGNWTVCGGLDFHF